MSGGKAPSKREALLRDVWQRWNEGERDSIIADVTDDCVLESQIVGQAFHGPEGIKAWMAELDAAWARWQLWLDEMRDLSGNRVLVLGGVRLEGRGSGISFDQRLGWVLVFEGDSMSRMTTYSTPEQAVEAASA